MADVRLQRYQIMEQLGRGSQGTTYRGIDRASGEEVAIKVLQLKGLRDWKGFELFERECKVLARLTHPGIPRFVDHYASEESGDYFLVMGLAPGESLRERRRKGEGLEPPALRKLFDDALNILDYLHSLSPPVVHRDIKPANLVLSAEGKLSLVDFGAVRGALRPDGGSTMIGTFGYMAPEQLHGEATPATDIYALGATFAALITGVAPEDMPRKGLKIDLSALIGGHEFEAVLSDMLDPDPSTRLQNAAAVRARLNSGRGTSRDAPPASKAKAARGFRNLGAVKLPVRRAAHRPATIPDEVQQLAQVRNPVGGLFIWIFAAMGSGMLTLFAAVGLPLIFLLANAFARSPRKDELKELKAETLASLDETRKTMRYLADAQNPLDRGGS